MFMRTMAQKFFKTETDTHFILQVLGQYFGAATGFRPVARYKATTNRAQLLTFGFLNLPLLPLVGLELLIRVSMHKIYEECFYTLTDIFAGMLHHKHWLGRAFNFVGLLIVPLVLLPIMLVAKTIELTANLAINLLQPVGVALAFVATLALAPIGLSITAIVYNFLPEYKENISGEYFGNKGEIITEESDTSSQEKSLSDKFVEAVSFPVWDKSSFLPFAYSKEYNSTNLKNRHVTNNRAPYLKGSSNAIKLCNVLR